MKKEREKLIKLKLFNLETLKPSFALCPFPSLQFYKYIPLTRKSAS